MSQRIESVRDLMRSFKFIHAADLHLDRPFLSPGNNNREIADVLRKSCYESLSRLVDTALQREVDFVVLAGDIYDAEEQTLSAKFRFNRELERLQNANIPVVLVRGNHDPLFDNEARSAQLTGIHWLGSSESETIPILREGTPIAEVSGISYEKASDQRNLADMLSAKNPNLYQIALLHTNCGSNSEHAAYAPCSLEQLLSKGFDYWALGHVHTRQILHENPWVVYPGNIQGGHIRETNPRGCYLVQVGENHTAELEFIRLDSITWTRIDKSVDKFTDSEELMAALREEIRCLSKENTPRPTACRIYLSGRTSLDSLVTHADFADRVLEPLREEGLLQTPLVWVEDLRVNVLPELSIEDLRQQSDLVGVILDVGDQLTQSGDLGRVLADFLEEVKLPSSVKKNLLEEIICPEKAALLESAEYLLCDLLQSYRDE